MSEGLAGRGSEGEARDMADPPPLCLEEQTTSSSSASGLEHSLRFLARWLVAAVGKAAPLAHSRPVEGSQIALDAVGDTEVASRTR
jgi:hypothetical protein